MDINRLISEMESYNAMDQETSEAEQEAWELLSTYGPDILTALLKLKEATV